MSGEETKKKAADKYPKRSTFKIPDDSQPGFSAEGVVGIFTLERRRSSVLSRNCRYSLIFEGKVLMCSKCSGVLANQFFMNEGPEVHVKTEEWRYKMTAKKKSSIFTVTDKKEEGICKVEYDDNYGDCIGPRKVCLTFGEKTYRSLIPISENGAWKLNFGSHFTVGSCRNVIMCSGDEEVMHIRKVYDGAVEVVVFEETPLYAVMALAVSNFTYIEGR